jgi:uncharacterized repeat protein (TIGR03806 family)
LFFLSVCKRSAQRLWPLLAVGAIAACGGNTDESTLDTAAQPDIAQDAGLDAVPEDIATELSEDAGDDDADDDDGRDDTGSDDTGSDDGRDDTGSDDGEGDTSQPDITEEVGEPEPTWPSFALEDLPFDTLDEYGFFVGELGEQTLAPGVLPYSPVSPLWADHAGKGRYVFVPEGAHITFEQSADDEGSEPGEAWQYPLGAVIIKTFYLDLDRSDTQAGEARIIETRLMIQEDDGWSMHTYVWNDEQNAAERKVAGSRVMVDVIDADGEPFEQLYFVPNTNECSSCHERSDVQHTLGLVAYQLDYDIDVEGESVNQLQWLADQGLFGPDAVVEAGTYTPLSSPTDDDISIHDRARSYLHANCAHCHREGGGGGRTGLDLRFFEEDPARYGVCKAPIAAGVGAGGRAYDIWPGEPDLSILPYRMATPDPEIRMPELATVLIDDFGVDLITEWILSMDGEDCE